MSAARGGGRSLGILGATFTPTVKKFLCTQGTSSADASKNEWLSKACYIHNSIKAPAYSTTDKENSNINLGFGFFLPFPLFSGTPLILRHAAVSERLRPQSSLPLSVSLCQQQRTPRSYW